VHRSRTAPVLDRRRASAARRSRHQTHRAVGCSRKLSNDAAGGAMDGSLWQSLISCP
jgi:hypothetical protein